MMKNTLCSGLVARLAASGIFLAVSLVAVHAQEIVIQGNTRVDEATIKSYSQGNRLPTLRKN